MQSRLPQDAADLQTPALLIRLDRVRSNIARMLVEVGGDVSRWRPHVKTTKIPEVLDLVIDRGVHRFKCATTREARVLLERAREPIDLLVAMAHRGANLDRVADLVDAHPRHRVSLLTEDADHAREVRAAVPAAGLFVDLDPGYHRSGIGREAFDRLRATAEAAGPVFRGLHDYEGHVRDPDPARRAVACKPIHEGLVDLALRLRKAGLACDELVTSGTPTFREALSWSPFRAFDHQVSPGAVVYWDGLSERLGIEGFHPAALVLARVISVPGPRRLTCDAGSKAIDAAGDPPCATVEGYPGLRAGTPSEEHLPLKVESGIPPAAGDLLRLVPAHVCPTVNLADEAVLLEGGEIVAVVPVAARGHELFG